MVANMHVVLLCSAVFLQNFLPATSSSSFDANTSTSLFPKWQTVVPDTGVVVALTGATDDKANGDTSSVSPPSSWRLSSGDGKYEVNHGLQLPSDLLTNLLHAGIIDDPYTNRNFLTQRHVWMGDRAVDDQVHTNRTRSWIYTTTFELPADESCPDESSSSSSSSFSKQPWTWFLIVEGIKMGATIEVNGVPLGTVTNQFLRYEFRLSKETHLACDEYHQNSLTSLRRDEDATAAAARCRKHNLTITFDPDIEVDGRYTACSGGWDWAPYVKSEDSQGKRSYTLGIVKPIYLIAVQDVAIHHMVPKIYYRGPYPREPMVHPAGDFDLQLDVHLNVVSSWNETNSKEIVVFTPKHQLSLSLDAIKTSSPSTAGEKIVTVNFTFPKEDIELWWPNGYGSQPLYNISVGIVTRANRNGEEVLGQGTGLLQKRIGFRTIALVTIDESDEDAFFQASGNQSEGSGSHGMYFRVNGALVLARGANFIPMDQLEGRLSEEAHRIAVRSAADANMNMMRVWGGGMVLPDAFYEACDEEGILLYHDMMFVDEAGHRPVQTDSVESEIRHLVRSLGSHPSIAVWNGCNECQVVMGTPSEIYATFVMQLVAQEDNTRSLWPSSPSKHGWKTGVYTLDSRPNGRPLSTWGPDDFPKDLETHGPYMRSFSKEYPGVNGIHVAIPYKNTPPTLSEAAVGTSLTNYFSSEFGASVMSSAESMEGTLDPQYWGVHGNGPPDSCEKKVGDENTCSGTNVLAERNYPCDTHIVAYFGNTTNLDAVGEMAFQEQMYHCMISQALWMKGEIETRRSTNSYGLLIWQMNENWPTGGWGCIEYGTIGNNNSQVVGGRWKPLMHLLESSLFRDVIGACGNTNIENFGSYSCYIRNDGQETLSADVVFESWKIGNAKPTQTLSEFIVLKADAIYRLSLPSDFMNGNSAIVITVDDNSSKGRLLETAFLPSHPQNIPELRMPVSVVVESTEALNEHAAEIRIRSDHLALYVVLTTRAQGRFSENAFLLRPMETKSILFIPMKEKGAVDFNLLRSTLRVEHLGYYLATSNISIEPKGDTSMH